MTLFERMSALAREGKVNYMADTAPQTEKKDVVPSAYRERYKASGGTCGDFIANKLQEIGKDGPPALEAVMRENKIDPKRWAGHNVGMQRMNLANVLRSTFLNGGDIYLLGKQHNLAHMRDDYNGTVENTDASIAKFAKTNDLGDSERVIKAIRKTLFEAAEKAKADEAKAAKKKADDEAKAKKKADAEAAKATKKVEAEKAATAKAAKKKADDEAKAAKKKADDEAKAAKKAAAAAKAATPAKVKEPA